MHAHARHTDKQAWRDEQRQREKIQKIQTKAKVKSTKIIILITSP